MRKHVNTFEGGMDMDSPFTNYPDGKYYKGEYIQVSKAEGNGNEISVKFINGNLLSYTLPSTSRLQSKNSYTQLGNKLVFITRESSTEHSISYLTIDYRGNLSGLTTVWNGDMGLSSSYPIAKMIGFYETESLQKIYWTDNYNRIRFCNIVDPDLASMPVDNFDVIPTFNSSNVFHLGLGSTNVTEISGNLKTGLVQYTYRMYNKHSSKTLFSPPTNLYTIYPKVSSSSSDYSFIGGDQGENSGKGLRINFLSQFDTDFQYLQIYRIYYENKNSNPEIGLVYDSELQDTTIFEDVGTTLDTISFQEFQFGSYDFICETLGTKNNVLFAGNVTENVWDVEFDARAYRFNNDSGVASILFDSTYTTYIQLASSGAWTEYNYGTWTATGLNGTNWSIPEDHDCINALNDQANAPSSVYPQTAYCDLHPTSLVKGGKGKYISFDFVTRSLKRASRTSPNIDENFEGYTNALEEKSFQRDEIYSFAIVLYNGKGQKSEPFWICDIRMPDTYDYRLTDLTTIYTLNPKFTINSAGLTLLQSLGCTDYQYVRCERTSSDKTIVAQGVVGGTKIGVGAFPNIRCGYVKLTTAGELGQTTSGSAETGDITYGGHVVGNIDRTLLEFISPEIIFTNDLVFTSGDYLKCAGLLTTNIQYYNTTNSPTSSNCGFRGVVTLNNSFTVHENYDNVIMLKKCLTSNYYLQGIDQKDVANIEISDLKIVSEIKKAGDDTISFSTVNIGGTSYYNYTTGYEGSSNIQGTHGTCAVLKASNWSNSNYLPVGHDYGGQQYPRGIAIYLFNYKRDIIPYGGHTYEARKYRKYIPCSKLSSTNGSTSNYIIGDTYITPFEYVRTMVSGNIGDVYTEESYLETITFYCESTINTRARKNKSLIQELTNNTNSTYNYQVLLAHESPGVYDNENSNLVYTQENPLYEYNDVYSKEDNIIKHSPKIYGNDEIDYRARIHYSERKEIGEIIDSWTIWKPFNYKDIDVNQGEIKALVPFKNDLYSFQTNGIAVLSVDERVLVNNNTAQQATLGTGGVLARYDYLTKQSGTSYPNSIVSGKFGIYYFDDLNISYNVVNEGNNSISILSGVQSYLNDIYSLENAAPTSSPVTDVFSGIDMRYGKIFFTNHVGDTSDYTIVYDEIKKQFQTIIKLVPTSYITTDKLLYSVSGAGIYLENSERADLRTYYGTRRDAKLTFVINPNKGAVSRFDVLEWTIFGEYGATLTNFNKIRFYNNYQDSGEIDLTTSNLFQILRKFRFNQIFTSNEERFKDEYMVVELICDEDTNNQINLNNVITTYSSTVPF